MYFNISNLVLIILLFFYKYYFFNIIVKLFKNQHINNQIIIQHNKKLTNSYYVSLFLNPDVPLLTITSF